MSGRALPEGAAVPAARSKQPACPFCHTWSVSLGELRWRRSWLLRLLLPFLLAGVGACSDGSEHSVRRSSPPTSRIKTPATSVTPSPESPTGATPVRVVGTHVDPRGAARRAGIDPAGAVAALSFADRNGVNIVVLRELQTSEGGRLLRGQQVATKGGRSRTLRVVRDGQSACEFDVTGEFLKNSFYVRDDDKDGQGEVTFIYRVACRSDVSSAGQKLLMLEGGKKYILRGSTATPYEPYRTPAAKPAPALWPAGSYARALHLFRNLDREF